MPVHELVQSAYSLQIICTWFVAKMIGIGQHYPASECLHLPSRYSFHGSFCADGHEHWSIHLSMRQCESHLPREACLCLQQAFQWFLLSFHELPLDVMLFYALFGCSLGHSSSQIYCGSVAQEHHHITDKEHNSAQYANIKKQFLFTI